MISRLLLFSLADIMFSDFSTVNYCSLFPSISLLTLWQEITMYSPYLRSRKSYSSSLRAGYSHYYSKFFCKGDWSPLPNLCIYSVMYLYQYRFLGTYFIFGVIIQYFFILLFKLSQDWALELFQSVSSPFDIPHQCSWFLFLALSCFLVLKDAPSWSHIFPAILLEWAVSWMSLPGSFYWRMVLQTKIWAVGVFVALGVSWL